MAGPASTPSDRFETTHWSLVARAGESDEASQRAALSELLRRYGRALQVHLTAGKRLPPDRAEDLVQAFIADKVIEQNLIALARKERGRFRTFLLTALDRFAIDQIRHDRAKKRSADNMLAVDEELDAADPLTPSPGAGFDAAWARELLTETIRRMKDECEASGRADVWGVFDDRMLGPMLHDSKPMAYEELITRYGIASPAQASNLLVTGKRMFARTLKGLIGQYEKDPEQIEAEIADLQAALGRAG
jgi:RNA polymerase sigma-70 factor (ECF subfamily)